MNRLLLDRRRMMLVASPYDAATTAYLKATYPAYWGAIRDYGYAHPALIPFINEDNDLICSLVNVEYKRWLINDGNSWIDTNYYPNNTSYLKAYIKPIQVSSASLSGAGYGVNSLLLCVGCASDGYVYGGVGTTTTLKKLNVKLTANVYAIIEANGNTGYLTALINKVTYSSYIDKPSFAQSKRSIYLFARHLSTIDAICNWKATQFIYGDDNETHKAVPFVSSLRNGMIDIYNPDAPVFLPNVGTGVFTTEKT